MNPHRASNPIVEDTRLLLERFCDETQSVELVIDAELAEKIIESNEALGQIFDRIAGADIGDAESALEFVKRWLYFEQSFTKEAKHTYEMAVAHGASRRGEDVDRALSNARPSFRTKLETERKRSADDVGNRIGEFPREQSDSDGMDGEEVVQTKPRTQPVSLFDRAMMNQGFGPHATFGTTQYAADGGVLQFNTIFATEAGVPPRIPDVPRPRIPLPNGHRDGGRRRERQRDDRRFRGGWNEPHERSRSGRRNNGRRY